MTQAIKRKYTANRLSVGVTTSSQLFQAFCWIYLVCFFIMPDGFGFRLVFLWSSKRIAMFICYAMILANKKRLTEFWQGIKACTAANVFIILYGFILTFTALYRRDLNCITSSLLDEVMVFYLFYYLFHNKIITISKFISFTRVVLVVLCIEGIFEAITGVNLFGLISFANDGWSNYGMRGGGSRISGNCHHAILFGVYLSILFFLSCVDLKKNRLYLFRSPLLFILTSICVFLTGSRAPLGIYIMCIILICLFSNKDERIKSLIILLLTFSLFALFTMIVYRAEAGRQIMYMLTNMWDAMFDTRYAENWGGTTIGSTEYREALSQVFQLDYFNKLIGRGVSYKLSVVIDGYWLRSCDNSYVRTYISYAYPGLVILIMHGIIMLSYSLKGLWKQKKYLFSASFVVVLCYFLNIWYVATMGTYTYMWMLFALICACIINEPKIKLRKRF